MRLSSEKSTRGYTLLEIVIIVLIVGILSAIAAPSWLGFLARLRLNAARSQALSIMRDAQASAKREKRVWQASFRNTNSGVQWSVHPENAPEPNRIWNNLIGENADKIEIDQSYSTLRRSNQIYYVQFQHKGWLDGVLTGRITFVARGVGGENATRRCVFVSTILGALRTDENRGCQRE